MAGSWYGWLISFVLSRYVRRYVYGMTNLIFNLVLVIKAHDNQGTFIFNERGCEM